MDINLVGTGMEPAHIDKDFNVKPWYKKWWFWLLGTVVVLWFSLPYIITPLAEKYEEKQIGQLTGNTTDSLDWRILATSDDPVIGPQDAPVVIIEFLDYQCPFCREAYPIMKQVVAAYPDTVKLIIRDFPIDSVHPEAINAAVAANCAEAQGKFWQYHDALYIEQDNLGGDLYAKLATKLALNSNQFTSCIQSLSVRNEIGDDFNDGVRAGVTGTPTFFVNGQKVEGPLPFELWQKIIKLTIEDRFN